MQKLKLNVVAATGLGLSLWLTGWAAGCGGNPAVSAVQVDTFVGTWKFDQETLTANCGAAVQPISQDLAGQTLSLTRGAGAQITLTLTPTCQVLFTVSGNIATATANQTCTLTVGQAGAQSIAVTSWTMTTDDGATMTTSQMGSALSGLCAVSGSGHTDQAVTPRLIRP